VTILKFSHTRYLPPPPCVVCVTCLKERSNSNYNSAQRNATHCNTKYRLFICKENRSAFLTVTCALTWTQGFQAHVFKIKPNVLSSVTVKCSPYDRLRRSRKGQKYSYTLSLASALDGDGWFAKPRCRFTHEKRAQKTMWAPGSLWTDTKHLSLTRVRTLDLSACSELLHRLMPSRLPLLW